MINAPANTSQNRYVQSTSINGKPFTKNWISQREILNGGMYVAVMGSKPDISRGIAEKDFPYSFFVGEID
jgi:putative alpha-1,2-mannosidase